jgi:hypothetical protein
MSEDHLICHACLHVFPAEINAKDGRALARFYDCKMIKCPACLAWTNVRTLKEYKENLKKSI